MQNLSMSKIVVMAMIVLAQCTAEKGQYTSYNRVETNLKIDIRSLYELNNKSLKNAISLLIMSKNGDIPFDLVEKMSDSIVRTSIRYDFDPLLITSIIYKESEFNPFAISSAGAIGLMQIMPKYFEGKGDNIYDIDTNIRKGVEEISRLRDKYHNYPDVLMAYLAGEGALKNYKRDEISEETAILMDYYSYIILLNYQILSGRYRDYLVSDYSLLSMK